MGMADKQLAYDARKNTDLFDDDDPLAELARIVGFEPRVAANTVSETPRQEPAFDLEDELLREFERYDSPRPLAALDRPADPAPEEAVGNDEPSYDVAPAEADVDIALEAAAVEPEPAAKPHWDAREVLAAADWAASQGREAEPISGGARDLIEELELSISAAPSKAPQWSAASIRLPLANFHTARREEPAAVPSAEPVAIAEPATVVEPAPVAVEPAEEFELEASTGFPAEIDRHDEALPAHDETFAEIHDETFAEIEVDHTAFDLAAAAKDGFVPSDAALTEAVAVETSDPAVLDLDALLADVSRYSLPQRPAEPVIAKAESEYAAVDEDEVEEQPQPQAFVAPVPAPAPATAAAKPEQDFDDPFAGHDFELDLEGIELELADLDFAEPAKAQQIEPSKPQTTAAPVVAAAAVSAPVARPVPVAAAPVVAPPAPVQAAPPSSSFSDAGEDLPFDPSMISDAEYHPEAVEEMHIPALPPVERPEPVVTASDFDFDVDAEIANLLAPAKPQEPVAKAAAAEWHAPAAAATVAKPVIRQSESQGFDEFERALEEDFRRSVSEPVQRKENLSQVRIESASQAEDRNRARSMRRLLAAAAMIVVFGGIAYGGYSFMSHGGSLGISSGEPRVITADKDPVKVVPENPGGKTVPNQDKAVYDSVGGAAAEAPKQKALVSSDEEPVDVVQRTLTPETSPEDNDSDVGDQVAMGTPVGDTEDPRLLPNQQDTADAAVDNASDADKTPAVSPRKVRTMIVKPDGTLVAREELAPAKDAAPLDLPKATQVQTQKILPGAAPANGSAASFPATTEVASADIRATPGEGTPAPQQPSQSPLAAAAAATPAADVAPPLRPVKSTKVSDTAPVPTARPTEQPVNVVNTVTEKGNVRPVAQQQPKPAEVAAVEPAATKPLQPAAAKTPPVAATGGYGMQIASLPSEDEAKKSYASLSNKFAGVLSGRSYEIRKADIAGKGTFYRVRIPAGSKDEAAALCEKYRTAGGSCLISK
jgi:hypothetical protein